MPARNAREQALVDAVIATMLLIDGQRVFCSELPESHAEKWTTLHQGAVLASVRATTTTWIWLDEEILTMWCRIRKSPDTYGCPRARKEQTVA